MVIIQVVTREHHLVGHREVYLFISQPFFQELAAHQVNRMRRDILCDFSGIETRGPNMMKMDCKMYQLAVLPGKKKWWECRTEAVRMGIHQIKPDIYIFTYTHLNVPFLFPPVPQHGSMIPSFILFWISCPTNNQTKVAKWISEVFSKRNHVTAVDQFECSVPKSY